MTDPIQSSINSSSYLPIEGASAEETNGQICLSTARPSLSASPSDATGAAQSSSPAVISLVMRFAPPTGAHPPVEPSFKEAAANCSLEIAHAALGVGTAALAAATNLFVAVLPAAHALVSVGSAARCVERDEAAQVAKGEIANQSADCVRDGAVPLSKADGSVICAFP